MGVQKEERQLVILERQATIVHPRLCFLCLLPFSGILPLCAASQDCKQLASSCLSLDGPMVRVFARVAMAAQSQMQQQCCHKDRVIRVYMSPHQTTCGTPESALDTYQLCRARKEDSPAFTVSSSHSSCQPAVATAV